MPSRLRLTEQLAGHAARTGCRCMGVIGDAGVEVSGIPLVVDPSRGRRAPSLELAQGIAYLAAGLWPLLGPRSLQPTLHPRSALRLAKTVASLLSVVGGVLVYSGLRGRRPSEMALLGMGTAAALASIDVAYVAKRRIPRIYLLDAAGQLMLLGAWALGKGRLPWRRSREGMGSDAPRP